MRVDKFTPKNGDMSVFENIPCILKHQSNESMLFLQHHSEIPYDTLDKSQIVIEEVTDEEVGLMLTLYQSED